MAPSRYLYVVFSATPYKMGKFIRMVTGEPYNHVSIATEEDLRHCYSFARRYYRTPFYGGFVTEEPSRFCPRGVPTHIRLCRLPLTQSQWETLQAILSSMDARREHYLYNHLSALTAPIHRKVPLRDTFTCAEFAVSVLSALGFDFDPRRFYSIGSIARRLAGYHIYTGVFPAESDPDAAFFQPHPLRHPLCASAKSFFLLFLRAHGAPG